MAIQDPPFSKVQIWLNYSTYGWKSWAALGVALVLWAIIFAAGGYFANPFSPTDGQIEEMLAGFRA
jgi:hypothetical protein